VVEVCKNLQAFAHAKANLNRIIPAEGVMKTRLFSFYSQCVLCVLGGLFCIALLSCGGSDTDTQRKKEVVVYAYDSFTAEWGPGPELEKRFEAATGFDLRLVSCGDAGQVLSRSSLEKKNPQADVLVGIDNNLIELARSAGVLSPYKSANGKAVPEELILDRDWLLTPYDWGYFAIIFDTASGLTPPASLEDLTKPEYAKKLILMDPRTSTPGTGFLAWTLGVYGKDHLAYWNRLKGSILTMAPGWDTGYGLFTSGEAPLVISYTTSPAYHVEFEGTDRYKALIFPEGHTAQIEGMGLVKGAKNSAGGKAFIDFMLTEEAQGVLPLTQFMYPVSAAVKLPASFDAAPRSDKLLSVPSAEVSAALDGVMAVLSK
jgi:thiamine transport system substrate-binding protein